VEYIEALKSELTTATSQKDASEFEKAELKEELISCENAC
jgi:hypothetical protein